MIWNCKNGSVPIGDTAMDCVSFGYGETPLVLLPGLSDGLATVAGKALLLAAPYRLFFRRYTVYMFSRKNDLADDTSIRAMAADQAEAMHTLGLSAAHVVGVSEGGMIAQYLAIDHPECVEKLVLSCTAPCVNDRARACVQGWIAMAKRGDHKALMIDTAEKSYSAPYLKKYRAAYPILGWISRPKDYRRFLANANAILSFDATASLGSIRCPTLILIGDADQIVGVQPSFDLQSAIADSRLRLFPGLGHAIYEEAPDFNQIIYDFFAGSSGDTKELSLRE